MNNKRENQKEADNTKRHLTDARKSSDFSPKLLKGKKKKRRTKSLFTKRNEKRKYSDAFTDDNKNISKTDKSKDHTSNCSIENISLIKEPAQKSTEVRLFEMKPTRRKYSEAFLNVPDNKLPKETDTSAQNNSENNNDKSMVITRKAKSKIFETKTRTRKYSEAFLNENVSEKTIDPSIHNENEEIVHKQVKLNLSRNAANKILEISDNKAKEKLLNESVSKETNIPPESFNTNEQTINVTRKTRNSIFKTNSKNKKNSSNSENKHTEQVINSHEDELLDEERKNSQRDPINTSEGFINITRKAKSNIFATNKNNRKYSEAFLNPLSDTDTEEKEVNKQNMNNTKEINYENKQISEGSVSQVHPLTNNLENILSEEILQNKASENSNKSINSIVREKQQNKENDSSEEFSSISSINITRSKHVLFVENVLKNQQFNQDDSKQKSKTITDKRYSLRSTSPIESGISNFFEESLISSTKLIIKDNKNADSEDSLHKNNENKLRESEDKYIEISKNKSQSIKINKKKEVDNSKKLKDTSLEQSIHMQDEIIPKVTKSKSRSISKNKSYFSEDSINKEKSEKTAVTDSESAIIETGRMKTRSLNSIQNQKKSSKIGIQISESDHNKEMELSNLKNLSNKDIPTKSKSFISNKCNTDTEMSTKTPEKRTSKSAFFEIFQNKNSEFSTEAQKHTLESDRSLIVTLEKIDVSQYLQLKKDKQATSLKNTSSKTNQLISENEITNDASDKEDIKEKDPTPKIMEKSDLLQKNKNNLSQNLSSNSVVSKVQNRTAKIGKRKSSSATISNEENPSVNKFINVNSFQVVQNNLLNDEMLDIEYQEKFYKTQSDSDRNEIIKTKFNEKGILTLESTEKSKMLEEIENNVSQIITSKEQKRAGSKISKGKRSKRIVNEKNSINTFTRNSNNFENIQTSSTNDDMSEKNNQEKSYKIFSNSNVKTDLEIKHTENSILKITEKSNLEEMEDNFIQSIASVNVNKSPKFSKGKKSSTTVSDENNFTVNTRTTNNFENIEKISANEEMFDKEDLKRSYKKLSDFNKDSQSTKGDIRSNKSQVIVSNDSSDLLSSSPIEHQSSETEALIQKENLTKHKYSNIFLSNLNNELNFPKKRTLLDFINQKNKLEERTSDASEKRVEKMKNLFKQYSQLKNIEKITQTEEPLNERVNKITDFFSKINKNEQLKPIVTKNINLKKSAKPIASAKLINGKVYRPKKLFRGKCWCTNRFYKFLQDKMRNTYNFETINKSEDLMKYCVDCVTKTIKSKKYEKSEVETFKRRLAQEGIIKTTYDFYLFVERYLPEEYRELVVPCTQAHTKEPTVPYNQEEVFREIEF